MKDQDNISSQTSQMGQSSLYPPYYIQQPVDDEIDLLEYWDLLWQSKALIAVITVTITALATAIALLMSPVYKAEVTLAPAAGEKSKGFSLGGLGGLASLAGISGVTGNGAGVKEALSILNSRAFLSDFFEREQLLSVLFYKQWDAKKATWLVEEDKQPTMWDAYKRFTKGILSTNIDKDSGMVILSISWRDPELAAKWANLLVVRLNAHMREQAISEASKSIEYLQNQINQTSVLEMQQMLYSLVEEETKKIMLANVRNEYAFKVIDPAVVPEEKIKPKRALIAVLGLVLGLFFSVFFVFFREFVRKAKLERSQGKGKDSAPAEADV